MGMPAVASMIALHPVAKVPHNAKIAANFPVRFI